MNTELVNVLPSGAGWMVSTDILAAPLFFHSGARAEFQARKLTAALLSSGHPASLVVHDWSGAVVARMTYEVAQAAPRPASSPRRPLGGVGQMSRMAEAAAPL